MRQKDLSCVLGLRLTGCGGEGAMVGAERRYPIALLTMQAAGDGTAHSCHC